MEVGEARIQGSFFRFLIIGFSWMALFFIPSGARKKVQVMSPWVDRRAHHCPECGALLIAGESGGDAGDEE